MFPRNDFSIKKCIDFTKEVDRIAQQMQMSTQECIYVFAQMLNCTIHTKGMDYDEVMKLAKDWYLELRSKMGGIILP